MTSNKVIGKASPHTIKKFELVENYIEGWAQKLLNFKPCDGIIFIDCMCNSGVYKDNDGKECIGTPVRVAPVLQRCAAQYSGKAIDLYFNDNSLEKIALLKEQLPSESSNFHIHTSVQEANAF